MIEVFIVVSVFEFEREVGFEGIFDLWRRYSGIVFEVGREVLYLGRVFMVRYVFVLVWVVGFFGEEVDEGVFDLIVVRRLVIEGVRLLGEEIVSRGSLGFVGRG